MFFDDVGKPGGSTKGEMMWSVWEVVSERSGGHPSRRRQLDVWVEERCCRQLLEETVVNRFIKRSTERGLKVPCPAKAL